MSNHVSHGLITMRAETVDTLSAWSSVGVIQTSPRNLCILASSYAGKSTFHREGLGIDPEELPGYRALKVGFKEDRIPEVDQIRRAFYGLMADVLLSHEPAALLLHPPKSCVLNGDLTGRRLLLYAPPEAEAAAASALSSARSELDLRRAQSRRDAMQAGLDRIRLISDRYGIGVVRDRAAMTAALRSRIDNDLGTAPWTPGPLPVRIIPEIGIADLTLRQRLDKASTAHRIPGCTPYGQVDGNAFKTFWPEIIACDEVRLQRSLMLRVTLHRPGGPYPVVFQREVHINVPFRGERFSFPADTTAVQPGGAFASSKESD